MTRVAVADAAQALNEHFDIPERFEPSVPLDRLIENGHNARHKFDADKLNDLAASIRQKGIIEPLVVRPFTMPGVEGEVFEVVAGARRRRAAKIAGRTHAPCIVREYSDSDVLEIQIIENLQREDLDPLEEASGYKTLIESNKSKYSVPYIADKIGRSEAYVWDTLRLLNLVDEAKELLDTGRISRSHASILARLTHEQQERVIDVHGGGLWTPQTRTLELEEDRTDIYSDFKPRSVRELEAYIADHIRFNAQQAAEIAPLDYGETARLIEAAAAKPGRGKKVVHITHDSHVQPDARDENEKIFLAGRWKRADGQEGSATCELSVLGLIVVGTGYGQAFNVCIAKDKCDVHWKQERREKAKAEKLKTSGEHDKARELEEKRQKERQEAEQKEREARDRWQAAQPALIAAAAAVLKKTKPSKLGELVLTAIDGSHNSQYGKAARAHIPAKHRVDDVIRQAALIVLIRELTSYYAHEQFPKRAKALGIDVAAVLKAQKAKAGASR